MLLPLTLLGIVVVLSVLGVVVMLVPNDRLPTRTVQPPQEEEEPRRTTRTTARILPHSVWRV